MGHAHLISVVGDEPGSVLAGVADPRAATGGVAGY
jgi:hypothetical protein